MNRQYIGARYVPIFADPIEWSDQRVYEPLTIVTYMGASYTSRKRVPAGIRPTDNKYWAMTGNYNAQVEAYRQETVALTGLYEKVAKKFDTLPLNVTDYGAVGDNETDCTSAFQNAINDAIETGKAVYIPTGVYRVNSLTVNTNNGIRIMGEHSSNPNRSDHGAVLMYIGSGSLFTIGVPNGGGAAYNCLFENFSVRATQHFESVFSGSVNEVIFTDLTLTFSENICEYGFKFEEAQLTEVRNVAASRTKTFAKFEAALMMWFHHNNIWIADTGFEVNWGNYIIENNWLEWVTHGIKIDNNATTRATELSVNAVNNYYLCPNTMSEIPDAHFIYAVGTNANRSFRVSGNAINNVIDVYGDVKVGYPFYFERTSPDYTIGVFNVIGNMCSGISGATIYNNSYLTVVDTNNVSSEAYFGQYPLSRSCKHHTPVSYTEIDKPVGTQFNIPAVFLPSFSVEALIESDAKVTGWFGDQILVDLMPVDGKIYLSGFVAFDGTNVTFYGDVNGTKGVHTKVVTEMHRILFTGDNTGTVKYFNVTTK